MHLENTSTTVYPWDTKHRMKVCYQITICLLSQYSGIKDYIVTKDFPPNHPSSSLPPYCWHKLLGSEKRSEGEREVAEPGAKLQLTGKNNKEESGTSKSHHQRDQRDQIERIPSKSDELRPPVRNHVLQKHMYQKYMIYDHSGHLSLVDGNLGRKMNRTLEKHPFDEEHIFTTRWREFDKKKKSKAISDQRACYYFFLFIYLLLIGHYSFQN